MIAKGEREAQTRARLFASALRRLRRGDTLDALLRDRTVVARLAPVLKL